MNEQLLKSSTEITLWYHAPALPRLTAFYPPGINKTTGKEGGMLVRYLHHQQASLSDMQ